MNEQVKSVHREKTPKADKRELHDELVDSFPASDPPSSTQPAPRLSEPESAAPAKKKKPAA